MMRPLARLGLAGLLVLALSGCISLLPKSKPADLYRFGGPLNAAQAARGPDGKVGVFRTHSEFQRESAGDRILTVTNGNVAYIAGSRWVAPAAVLWDEAVLAAFDADPGPVRLVSRGEPAAAAYLLRVDVRNFEAHYDDGPKAAPTILVRVRATMMKGADRNGVVEQIFESKVRADDNRVTAIVAAFDKAVRDVLGQLVTWTDGQVASK
jgi:cholesterol transport system auxiliary component